ncbi:response regulator [Flammeovirga aprica]|uniref:Response regulator n=1 Tax=Flammeovirga aprica JL-4 TaxID=694437 RepID=A0A7X9RY16_9BACT|nr:response regulator [Flammeovirga aprica]NME70759.1 response regulator [Flammeovirga aprica JL-4]
MLDLPLKILIVEDNIADAELISYHIRKIISKPSIQISTLYDETINVIEMFRPDIILSDYQLNSFNGLDVLQYVSQSLLPIPIIFITGTVNNTELAPYTIIEEGNGIILKEDMSNLQKKLYPFFQHTSNLNLIKKNKIETEHAEFIDLNNLDVDIPKIIEDIKRAMDNGNN